MASTEKSDIRKGLMLQAIGKFGIGFVVIGLIFFISAGSIRYWNAWLYMLTLAVPMIFVGVYLYIKDPALLKKRLNMKETEKKQKHVILLSILVFLLAFALPGIDYRFGWSHISPIGVGIGVLIMLVGYGMFVAVLLQNSYASRVIEVQEDQKIIDTGVYAIVRHPMYLASSILFLATPIVLGSYYSLIPMLLYPIILASRIKNEEAVLMEGLEGYCDYMKKVKYRMIPYIW